ncbi:phosphatidylethanolamine-binding protein 4-like [Haliotis rufescens]|uniref:phosphatidylethanolamine-binding protein 4-like n=1 Tax=Haliotis rufescens TaxID=6454 RepID=UPI001EB06858|nr:phosphatidylethanolamine-binding protein 4-like [Haliotis rufescens]
MYATGLLVVCFLQLVGGSDAHRKVDNTLCTKRSPPKLGIYYSGHKLACNARLHIGDVSKVPRIKFKQGRKGRRYVLVFVDPDAPHPGAKSHDSNYLHYAAVVKKRNGELKPSKVLVHYRGPHPPKGTHRYQFYVFRWKSCKKPVLHNSDKSRGHFNLKRFKKENHLKKPVAVFQLKVPHT